MRAVVAKRLRREARAAGLGRRGYQRLKRQYMLDRKRGRA